MTEFWRDKTSSRDASASKKAPQGVTGEVGDEGAEEKQGKKKENSRRQNCWIELFRGFPRVCGQSPRVVETEAARDERDYGDEEDPVDVGHVVHQAFLKVADVAVVAQPAFISSDRSSYRDTVYYIYIYISIRSTRFFRFSLSPLLHKSNPKPLKQYR